MRARRLLTVLLATLALNAACGSDSSTGIDPTNNNASTSCNSKFTATVNGTAWCALNPVANYYAGQQQVVFTGVNFGGTSSTWSLSLSTSSVTAAGTYSLTTLSPLRFAVVGSSTGVGYSTVGTGASGTITYTTFSPTHVVGTFSFSAPPTTGGGSAVTVTNGSFDLTLVAAQ